MIPPDIWPKSEAEGQQRANELAQSYPLDPRAHLFLAEFLLKKGDRDGAIHEAEVARSSDALKVFKPDVRARMVEIATSLIEEGRKAPAPAAPAQPEAELGKSTPTDTREAASLQSSSNPSASSPPSQDAGVPQHAPAFVSQPIPHFAPPQQAALEPTKEASNRSEDGPNDATSQELSEDARAWNEVRTSRSISRLNKFARAYPQSPYAPIARQLSNLLLQDEQLKAWRRGLEQRANGAPPSRP
jgi:hypothetical protein